MELLSPCFPANSNFEDVRAVLKQTNVVVFGNYQVLLRLADPKGLDGPAKVIQYVDGIKIKDLISPKAKPRFGEYKRGSTWERSEEDVEWSVNFIKAALSNDDVSNVQAGGEAIAPGFLSQPMDLQEPMPAPGASSSEGGLTAVEQEPHDRTAWNRKLRSMDSSSVIELDSPSPKKQRVDASAASENKILTEKEEFEAMATSDMNVTTLSQELEELMKGDDNAIAELSDLAPARD
eukprot:2526439-Amphidinium_carterae.2